MSPGDTEIHRVEPEDVANHLTAFHWELFRCVHEVGTVAGAGLGGLGGRNVPTWGAWRRATCAAELGLRRLAGRGPLGNSPRLTPHPLSLTSSIQKKKKKNKERDPLSKVGLT